MILLNSTFRPIARILFIFIFIFASTLLAQPPTPMPAVAQTDGPTATDEIATVPTGFTDASVTTVTGNATGLALLPDGRLLIAVKEGKLSNSSYVVSFTPNREGRRRRRRIGVLSPKLQANG